MLIQWYWLSFFSADVLKFTYLLRCPILSARWRRTKGGVHSVKGHRDPRAIIQHCILNTADQLVVCVHRRFVTPSWANSKSFRLHSAENRYCQPPSAAMQVPPLHRTISLQQLFFIFYFLFLPPNILCQPSYISLLIAFKAFEFSGLPMMATLNIHSELLLAKGKSRKPDLLPNWGQWSSCIAGRVV